ncbi:alpha/beta hydrolase [Oscillibacter sp. MSJ-2]|uniref:Alpha/beta hydrolase n=1 Tax=Dysosmobacter acutus TaxID=2841504 RepID=A0ABS6FBZ0_9FIRM|nr:alpha/beta hydrolase [Dysosmobacter acutus]MBU5627583.1 alpha/beta hydrolase [Dysosmobacter acutus]
MQKTTFDLPIGAVPAVLYGAPSPEVWLYVHGKCGCKEEGEDFARLACPRGAQVLAIDLPEHGARKGAEESFTPWDIVPELRALLAWARQRWETVSLRATSLGAWFSLVAFGSERLKRALLVSPVLDMERLIRDMMGWAGVGEEQLEAAGEVPTDFGETLSYKYLLYAGAHSIQRWDTPTAILYAGQDGMTGRKTVEGFVRRFDCELYVMEDGEHWFHTPEQLLTLRSWEDAHL